jgi:hypothetical protein
MTWSKVVPGLAALSSYQGRWLPRDDCSLGSGRIVTTVGI